MAGLFFPKPFQDMVPYHFYHVLTDSMEPFIPRNSIVCVKKYDENTVLDQDDVITFRALRFGEKIIITHRFSHTETDPSGNLIFRTHPEVSDTLDAYKTRKEDILGIYLFHVPFVGKWILFLKSTFGVLWICEMILILLIREMIAARWLIRDQQV